MIVQTCFLYHFIRRNSKFVDQGDVTVIMNSICFPGNVRLSLAYLSCGASLVIAKMNFSALDLADAVRRNKVRFLSFNPERRLSNQTGNTTAIPLSMRYFASLWQSGIVVIAGTRLSQFRLLKFPPGFDSTTNKYGTSKHDNLPNQSTSLHRIIFTIGFRHYYHFTFSPCNVCLHAE